MRPPIQKIGADGALEQFYGDAKPAGLAGLQHWKPDRARLILMERRRGLEPDGVVARDVGYLPLYERRQRGCVPGQRRARGTRRINASIGDAR